MIYVTGYRGNLGKVLLDSYLCYGLDCDVKSTESIRKALKKAKSNDVLINCAAFTDVDECELGENRSEALHVNTAGIANLRDEFPGKIIHISTDYIFNGIGGPYSEKDDPDPINWYGQTKLCGEERLLEFNSVGDTIVRTTILYGGHKPDFATKVLTKLRDGKSVEVPTTIRGTPTHVFHLAQAIMKLISLKHPPKIVNIAGDNVLTRYEFALMIANVFKYPTEMIVPTTKFEYVAKRPRRAGLRVDLAKKLKLPIYPVASGLDQLYLEKAFLYGNK